jgi:hypothetical protein
VTVSYGKNRLHFNRQFVERKGISVHLHLGLYQLLCQNARTPVLGDDLCIGSTPPRLEGLPLTPREAEEYRALRATIRERGTARVWVFIVGIGVWAALTMATVAVGAVPLAALVPLVMLAATFEAVFALHIGVERIGRYIQVFHESDESGWEHTIGVFGRGVAGGSTDALFVWIFASATVLNFVPVILAEPVPVEVYWIGGAHLLLLVRIAIARRASTRQRAAELARFNDLKRSQTTTTR